MPFRRGGFSRRNRAFSLQPVDSNKNIAFISDSTGTTSIATTFVNTVDSATLAVPTDVERGCSIKAFWISLDFCGLGATGVRQVTRCYIIKNPGANLAPPTPGTEGTSNEKKFIFKEWQQMTMRNQNGNPPYHWEGWIKIPKRYQRFGANDLLQMVYATDTSAGHITAQIIYKWYK